MKEKKRIAAIFNPVGGSSNKDDRQRFFAACQRLGAEVVPMPTTAEPGSAYELAKEARLFDTVVAMGGDGTVSLVAQGLIECSEHNTLIVPNLAVRAAGTMNFFANSFYSQPTPEAFAEMILSPNALVQEVDVIEVTYLDTSRESRKHISLAGVCAGRMVRAIDGADKKLKKDFGELYMAARFIEAACDKQPLQFQVESNDYRRGELPPTRLWLALNTLSGNWSTLSPGCSPFDGLMDYVGFENMSFDELWKIGQAQASRVIDQSGLYKRTRVAECTVSSINGRPFTPNIDGEAGYPTYSMYLEVLPRSLSVILI